MKYARYPKYVDSGVEWLGEIPEGWKIIRLRYIFDIKAGGDLDDKNYSPEMDNEFQFPIFTNSIKSEVPYGFSRIANYQANSITVTGRGEIGIAKYRECQFDAIIRLLVLSPISKNNCKYFEYFINAMPKFFGGSTAISQLSAEQISPYKVSYPSLSAQQAITDFLDTETAKINGLIKDYEELIELLQEKRQVFISHAVTRGLSELVSPDDPEFGEWAKPVTFKDSGVEWIGEIPEKWDVLRFGQSVYIQEGQVDPKDEAFLNTILIAPNHIESGTGRLLASESAIEQGAESGKYLCKKGDVIYSKIRPKLAKVTIAACDCLCSADMYPLSGKDNFTSEYLMFYLLTPEFTEWAVLESERVAMPKINRESLSAVKLPKPSFAEQQAIGSYLNRELCKIDMLVDETESAIELLKEHRSALITNAVTGKINVEGIVGAR